MLSNLSEKKNCARCGNFLLICLLFSFIIFFDFYSSCRYNGEFNTVKLAKVLFFIYELGDSFHLKKELYFIQAQLCGPAIHGPQGINVLSTKKNYADPCSILVRPQAQLCGPAVHDPREAVG